MTQRYWTTRTRLSEKLRLYHGNRGREFNASETRADRPNVIRVLRNWRLRVPWIKIRVSARELGQYRRLFIKVACHFFIDLFLTEGMKNERTTAFNCHRIAKVGMHKTKLRTGSSFGRLTSHLAVISHRNKQSSFKWVFK